MAHAKRKKSGIIYDAIGVGAHVGSTLKDLKFYQYAPFLAGGKVVKPDRKYRGIKQKDYFSNLKAQAWVGIADRALKTYNAITKGEAFNPDEIISFDSTVDHLDKLLDELSTPYKEFDNAGRYKVESKDDMKDRGFPSTNIADSLVMANSRNLVRLGAQIGGML